MTINTVNSTQIDRIKTLPMPKADSELLDAVLEQGFRTYPERRANYEKFKRAKNGEEVDHLPIRLDIEHVSRCNFRCTMCQVSDWPKQARAEDMTLWDYTRLLDQQIGLIEIKLQGMGEPLMAAETYFPMISHARERHIWVRSTVNGSLLHLKENYKRLIDSDICELQVSLDGATKSSYETIRRGAKFERVTRNCELLNAYAGECHARKRTRMWVVVQRENFEELEMLPTLASDLGFERLTLSLDLNDWGQDEWRDRNDQVDMHRTFDANRAHDIVALGAECGVETTFWFIDEKYRTDTPSKLCPWPFERAYISSDMRIVPCCMIANPDVFELGDARDLTEAWNGPEMRAFRRAHLSGSIPDVCRTCYATKDG